MSQLQITNAGIDYRNAVFAGDEVQNITHFVFANKQGQDASAPIDPNTAIPVNILHTQPVKAVSKVDGNAIVISAVLGYDIGDFEYNWYGVVATKANNEQVLIAVVTTETQTKAKTVGAVTGNYSVKSIVWRSQNIADELNITLSVLPWQVQDEELVSRADFDAALNGKLDKTATAANSLKLAGQSADYYKDIVSRLGYQPVQQGGGANQSNNKIYIGWDGAGKLRLQVDTTDFGHSWPIDVTSAAYLNGRPASFYGTAENVDIAYGAGIIGIEKAEAAQAAADTAYAHGTGAYNLINEKVKTNVPAGAVFTDTQRPISDSLSSTSSTISASVNGLRIAYNAAVAAQQAASAVQATLNQRLPKPAVKHYYTTGNVTVNFDDAQRHIVTRWGDANGTIMLAGTLSPGDKLIVINVRDDSGVATITGKPMYTGRGSELDTTHTLTGQAKLTMTAYSAGGLMLTEVV